MSSDDTKTDGGVPGDDELFSVSDSTVTETSSDRLYRLLDEYFYAPIRIAWSSWRTRIGIPLFQEIGGDTQRVKKLE